MNWGSRCRALDLRSPGGLLGCGALLLVSCGCASEPSPPPSAPVAAPAVSSASSPASPPTSPPPVAATPSASPRAPIVVQPLRSGHPPEFDAFIEIPEPLLAELERLLAAVAKHSSTSSACIDGPGHTFELTLLAVELEPGAKDQPRWVRIHFAAVRRRDGGYQACSGTCPPELPSWGIGEVSIAFVPSAGGRILRLPPKWPLVDGDIQPMTPLDKEHDGDCFGKSPAFAPARVPDWP